MSEQAFERAFADYHGAKHGIFMTNGTVTLQCALGALGVGPGDEVIVPALTWMATVMAVHYVGATPVFVDVEPDTLCLDPVKVRQALTAKTKAIIPVHLYGALADLDALLALAKAEITPQVGVELCGFGPFLNRHSVGLRDRLWARAMAVRAGERRAVVITCDLLDLDRRLA